MIRKIYCLCESTFEEDIPQEIDLDKEPAYLNEILDGSLFSFTCKNCNKKHKPEFLLTVLWPSRKLRMEVFPELDRSDFFRRQKAPVYKDDLVLETVIGYPEMADRIAVLNDGLDPVATEAIKYYLHMKAEEQSRENEIIIWYYGLSDSSHLLFHIHGMRSNEIAKMKIPLTLYDETLNDYKKHPKKEIYKSLRFKTYLSVRNTMKIEFGAGGGS